MSVLILLIGCSILIAGGFLMSFTWSVKKGQYDDYYTPSVRMLFDDKPVPEEEPSLTPKQKSIPMQTLETFQYDNKIVRNFAFATTIWGVVGMSVGHWVALLMV